MLGPLTYLDAALIAIALISALLAMYRGLTRELLSIVSWAVAAAAVLYFVLYQREFAKDMADQMGAQLPVAQIAIGSVIFLIVLIVVHLLTARLSDAILASRVGMVDRILGFFFGLARGFVLIVIPYMFYESFFPDPATHFPWVRESASLPYIKGTGETFKTVILQYMPDLTPAPAPGEQQGLLDPARSGDSALVERPPSHISVTWRLAA